MLIEDIELRDLCERLSIKTVDSQSDGSKELADFFAAIQRKFIDFGIQIVNKPPSKWNIRHIAIQAAAQVIGYLNDDFNIRKIKYVLLKQFGDLLQHLLYLDLWKSPENYNEPEEKDRKDIARALERLIASVNPIPQGARRGRRSSKKNGEIVCIPGIFEEAGGTMKIHFQKLRIALGYLSLLLALFKGPDVVIGHPIILKYFNRVPPIFHGFLRMCVETGLEKASRYLQKS